MLRYMHTLAAAGLVMHTWSDHMCGYRWLQDFMPLCIFSYIFECVWTHSHLGIHVFLPAQSHTHGHMSAQTCAAPGLSLSPLPHTHPVSSVGGEYFSDEQMRFRAPLLYEQYIGQYLTQEELSARAPASQPPKPGSPGTPTCPLSDLLLQSYQERELQQRLLQQQEEEEACLEEEEEEEDSDEEGEGPQQGGPCIQTPQPWACMSPLSMTPG